ncbi:MFS transporter [Pseudonocardia abyssalis]|uniref:MHS family MFS transporter n=1 Tax=Pseudonocardia abyssalis TaxID=2792008 RepID=A0ABS6USG5_9PSEU|nr:MFS transporter [Pseudonocardia abyssalis]MBW0113881.1 MHS family MFS transporter [Pseudonocardia abyssalis]MBW0135122.1 MHS family MFS transporter [Pseudonocardia abyssalis]
MSLRKILLIAGTGSAIDWYDFFIYGTAAALVFNTLFFPTSDPLVGTLLAFTTFAVGFAARPLGGAIFGHVGDRIGRKPALVTTLFLMGISTTLIGLLPTYDTIGVAAPIILVVLRLLQGIAVGGQWAGGALIATENAPPEKRGLYGSFAQIGVAAGLFLSTGVFLLVGAALSEEAFLSWGWRIPFLVSIVLVGIAAYAHYALEETAPMKEVRESGEPSRSPVLEVLVHHWRTVLLGAGSILVIGTSFYLFGTYFLSYGTTVLGLPRGLLLDAVLIGAALQFVAIPICGALSDRFGRRRVFLTGAVALALWVTPAFLLVGTGSPAAVIAAIAVGEVLVALVYGPQAALFAELFTARVRYSGASLGYQIGTLVGGALTPLIATALYAQWGSFVPVAGWVVLTAVASFVSVVVMSETARTTLDTSARSAGPALLDEVGQA